MNNLSDLKRNLIIENIPESADDDIFVHNKKLDIIYMNECAAKHFRSEKHHITGKNLKDIFPPDQYEIRKKELMKAFNSDKPLSFINKIQFPDGARWMNVKLVPIKDKKNRVLYVMGISRDITEEKLSEELIACAKNEWENAVDTMQDCIAIIDKDHRILRINRPMAKYLGISLKKANGLTCYEYLCKSAKPLPFCPLITRKMSVVSNHESDPGNNRITTERIVSPFFDSREKLAGCLYIVREKENTGNKVSGNNNESFMTLLRNAHYIIFMQDVNGKYIFFDSTPNCGLKNSDFMGKTPFDIFRPAEASRIWALTKQVIKTGQEIKQLNQIEDIMSFEHISPIKNAVGDVISTMLVIRNIVESIKKDFIPAACSVHNLTKRELEILSLIAPGYSSKQIAEKLGISKTTVDTHRARIMQKCNVHKTVELVQLATKLGLQ